MLKNYFKIAWRNLIKNKVSSVINISGLSTGMAVAMLIGLWMWSELSFNKNFSNYNRIAQVMQNQTFNGEVQTWSNTPMPLAAVLRNNYGDNFKHVILSEWTAELMLSVGEKRIKTSGNYMEPAVTDMLSLHMLKGTRAGLQDMNSIMLSASVAKTYFGNADPINKMMRLEDKSDVRVTGVYEDIPVNSSFGDLGFIAPWQLTVKNRELEKILQNPWGASWFQVYAQIADKADMNVISQKIKDAKMNSVDKEGAVNKPKIFLQPMSKWHLYSDFKNGMNVGGRIQFVWLFGIIGFFVLLLACINFMNLSTARSEKRAREVGVRKAVGSLRGQLIYQFFTESILVAIFSFVISIVLLLLVLPFFNNIADKNLTVPFNNIIFWLAGILFTIITGLIAGIYPALYLSSFQAVKVLKGTFRAGRFAAMPRKVLLVLQFTVSIVLVVGTLIVFKQIEFARERPVGYNRNNLLTLASKGIDDHYESFRNELIQTGKIAEVSESETNLTNTFITNSGLTWRGKSPGMQEEFVTLGITHEFGKTIDWQIKEGRDFSREFATDSTGIIVNETAVKYLGFQHPVGEILQWGKNGQVHIIGVVKDMITQNPYQPVKQSFFYQRKGNLGSINIKVAPTASMADAISAIKTIFTKYNPQQPLEYGFVDELYAKNFDTEVHVGKLATIFAVLAIFISCLGVFGMASFTAEQRTKEIGIRKVIGATVFNIWKLLSKDFVRLVIIAFVIAVPLSYYFMYNWLQNYEYRTAISWWVFAAAGIGALLITLLTVSFQAIKAAIANPVKSLRTE
ncbi:MAG: ABC transporter permease [Chitinophagaceae bacterium]